MVNFVEIDQICEWLKATTSVATVLSDRIYYWEPMNEVTDWIYLVINSISQVVNRVNKQALIEFRYIGYNENVRKKTLVDTAKIVADAIVTDDNSQLQQLGTFSFFKCVEWWDFRMFVDDKNRNLLIQDYIFYFIS